MKKHVVLCGFPVAESRMCYAALRSSMMPGIKSPEHDFAAERALAPTKHLLTHNPSDLLRVAKISSHCRHANKLVRLIVFIGDPRSLLTAADPAFPHQYSMSWDHSLEKNPIGCPSFTAPGMSSLAKASIVAKLDEDIETLFIRCEDLRLDPAREWARIEAFTGFDFPTDPTGKTGLPMLEASLKNQPVRNFNPTRLEEFCLVAAHIPRIAQFMPLFKYVSEVDWRENFVPRIEVVRNHQVGGTVIGYFTKGTLYEKEAERLNASATALGLKIHIEAIPDQGTWLANVRTKPSVLSDLRHRFKGPLLYVDVDAVFHENPWPALNLFSQDAAYCAMRDGLARSGTVLLNDTHGARDFLADWQARLNANPDQWDQTPLSDILRESAARGANGSSICYSVGILPISLCYVFDRDGAVLSTPPAKRVIEHLQASREQSDRLANAGGQVRLERRRVRIEELNAHKTG